MRSLGLTVALLLAGGILSTALADDARGRGGPAAIPVQTSPNEQQPVPQARPAGAKLDPSACASLCRFFEFLGSLERPAPAAPPVPTS